jgi:hypothetical protein
LVVALFVASLIVTATGTISSIRRDAAASDGEMEMKKCMFGDFQEASDFLIDGFWEVIEKAPPEEQAGAPLSLIAVLGNMLGKIPCRQCRKAACDLIMSHMKPLLPPRSATLGQSDPPVSRP